MIILIITITRIMLIIIRRRRRRRRRSNMQGIFVKLDNEHCYYELPKWMKTSREGKVAILWNQQVILKRKHLIIEI